ncbi:MAG: nucleoside-diphosphate sugar epimerase [Candidatus Sulfotelmatobacter sp.]|nr:nucleoside-diphosphate sugar epimerase [Candidatus Sulfotelmatobacter sp.]
MQDTDSIWTEFAGNSSRVPSFLPLKEYVSEKTLLITGAGGSIGSALACCATACNAKTLILLDSNEHNLHALEQSFDISSKVVHIPILGSISDSVLLAEIFALHRPQIILHAAACKHVPLMELNPLAAASTNILGTYALLQAASAYGVAEFIMVSTDKAVLPVSIMGATKRVAELLLFAHPEKALQRKAVRLGNVLGSNGSVGPLFLKQIIEGGPVTVTHPAACRFFLTLNHAVILLMTALSTEYETGILIPDLGPARTVEELARYLIAATGREQKGIEIIFTELRPGDKVEEMLLSPHESGIAQENGVFSTVRPQILGITALRALVEQITISIQRRDLRLLLESICEVVPQYRPSHALQQAVEVKRQIELCK